MTGEKPNGDPFRLDHRVALVTGGSRGIGRAVAVALAAAGAEVIVTSRSGKAPETQDAVREVGGECAVMRADFEADPGDRLVHKVVAGRGQLDILVNNAGVNWRAPISELTMPDWNTVMQVNLTATWVLAQAAAGHMAERGQGRIINLASLLSFQGGRTVAAYAAAKHAVAGVTKAMCNELAGQGVNVNAVAPGYVATEMNTALMQDSARSSEILARIPAGRWADPADIAGSVVFLAAPASAYVHGHVLVVDGGWMAR